MDMLQSEHQNPSFPLPSLSKYCRQEDWGISAGYSGAQHRQHQKGHFGAKSSTKGALQPSWGKRTLSKGCSPAVLKQPRKYWWVLLQNSLGTPLVTFPCARQAQSVQAAKIKSDFKKTKLSSPSLPHFSWVQYKSHMPLLYLHIESKMGSAFSFLPVFYLWILQGTWGSPLSPLSVCYEVMWPFIFFIFHLKIWSNSWLLIPLVSKFKLKCST